MEHLTISANGAKFHVVRAGHGQPLLLLHGWPEIWLTWEPVISPAFGPIRACYARFARLWRQRQA